VIKEVKILAGYRAFRLRVSMIGTQKTISGDLVKEVKGEDDNGGKKVARDKLSLQKQFIRKEFLADINALDSEFKSTYWKRTKPSPSETPGERQPRYDANELLKYVKDYEQKREALAEVFADNIGEIKAAAKDDLQNLYNDEDFPKTREAILDRFKIRLSDLHVVIIDDPNVPAEVKAAQVKQLQETLEKADKLGQQEKRDEFIDGAKTLLSELQKGKRIYQSVVAGLQLYCAEFHEQDDPPLAPLVTEVGKILAGKTADDFKNFKGDLSMALAVLEDVVPQAEKLGRVIDV